MSESEGLKGVSTATQRQEARVKYVEGLEQRFKAGQLQGVKRGLYLVPERTLVNQFEGLEGQPVFACVIASFGDVLRSKGIYNEELDSQARMVEEVRHLFVRGGIRTEPALDRLMRSRANRGLIMKVMGFERLIETLLKGEVAIHGNRGHMVFLNGIEHRPSEHDGLVVRKADPLDNPSRFTLQPLRELAMEEPFYRAFFITPMTYRVKLPTRRT